MKNFIYKNAPLVEVITEIKWALNNVSEKDGRQLDPNFELLKFALIQNLNEFSYVEHLVPDFIPREFLAYQPLVRFRAQAEQWPLFQIGPGILTANVVPNRANEYMGWSAFRGHTEKGIQALFKNYPMAAELLTIKSITLTYVDAFNSNSGMLDPHSFIRDKLGAFGTLPCALEKFADKREGRVIESLFETSIPLRDIEQGVLTIKCGSGVLNQNPAVILENKVTKEMDYKPKSANAVNEIMEYFDQCHEITRNVFEEFIAPKLNEILGEKIEIQ